MQDMQFIRTGLSNNGKLYPKFNKKNYNYSYVFGEIIKVTIIFYFFTTEGKIFFVRTENGNLRNIHTNKIFVSVAEAKQYIKNIQKIKDL